MNEQPQPDIDQWEIERSVLVPFRPEGCNISALEKNEMDIEENRLKHTRKVIGYIIEKGYAINRNSSSDNNTMWGITYPYDDNAICFPEHIIPTESREGNTLIIRRDIPALYIVSSFAHEASHLDRWHSGDEEIRDKMERMRTEDYMANAETYNSGEFGDEEAATDAQAFFLLQKLGVPVAPENFCTYVGRGIDYQTMVYEKITKELTKPNA